MRNYRLVIECVDDGTQVIEEFFDTDDAKGDYLQALAYGIKQSVRRDYVANQDCLVCKGRKSLALPKGVYGPEQRCDYCNGTGSNY